MSNEDESNKLEAKNKGLSLLKEVINTPDYNLSTLKEDIKQATLYEVTSKKVSHYKEVKNRDWGTTENKPVYEYVTEEKSLSLAEIIENKGLKSAVFALVNDAKIAQNKDRFLELQSNAKLDNPESLRKYLEFCEELGLKPKDFEAYNPDNPPAREDIIRQAAAEHVSLHENTQQLTDILSALVTRKAILEMLKIDVIASDKLAQHKGTLKNEVTSIFKGEKGLPELSDPELKEAATTLNKAFTAFSENKKEIKRDVDAAGNLKVKKEELETLHTERINEAIEAQITAITEDLRL